MVDNQLKLSYQARPIILTSDTAFRSYGLTFDFDEQTAGKSVYTFDFATDTDGFYKIPRLIVLYDSHLRGANIYFVEKAKAQGEILNFLTSSISLNLAPQGTKTFNYTCSQMSNGLVRLSMSGGLYEEIQMTAFSTDIITLWPWVFLQRQCRALLSNVNFTLDVSNKFDDSGTWQFVWKGTSNLSHLLITFVANGQSVYGHIFDTVYTPTFSASLVNISAHLNIPPHMQFGVRVDFAHTELQGTKFVEPVFLFQPYSMFEFVNTKRIVDSLFFPGAFVPSQFAVDARNLSTDIRDAKLLKIAQLSKLTLRFVTFPDLLDSPMPQCSFKFLFFENMELQFFKPQKSAPQLRQTSLILSSSDLELDSVSGFSTKGKLTYSDLTEGVSLPPNATMSLKWLMGNENFEPWISLLTFGYIRETLIKTSDEFAKRITDVGSAFNTFYSFATLYVVFPELNQTGNIAEAVTIFLGYPLINFAQNTPIQTANIYALFTRTATPSSTVHNMLAAPINIGSILTPCAYWRALLKQMQQYYSPTYGDFNKYWFKFFEVVVFPTTKGILLDCLPCIQRQGKVEYNAGAFAEFSLSFTHFFHDITSTQIQMTPITDLPIPRYLPHERMIYNILGVPHADAHEIYQNPAFPAVKGIDFVRRLSPGDEIKYVLEMSGFTTQAFVATKAGRAILLNTPNYKDNWGIAMLYINIVSTGVIGAIVSTPLPFVIPLGNSDSYALEQTTLGADFAPPASIAFVYIPPCNDFSTGLNYDDTTISAIDVLLTNVYDEPVPYFGFWRMEFNFFSAAQDSAKLFQFINKSGTAQTTMYIYSTNKSDPSMSNSSFTTNFADLLNDLQIPFKGMNLSLRNAYTTSAIIPNDAEINPIALQLRENVVSIPEGTLLQLYCWSATYPDVTVNLHLYYDIKYNRFLIIARVYQANKPKSLSTFIIDSDCNFFTLSYCTWRIYTLGLPGWYYRDCSKLMTRKVSITSHSTIYTFTEPPYQFINWSTWMGFHNGTEDGHLAIQTTPTVKKILEGWNNIPNQWIGITNTQNATYTIVSGTEHIQFPSFSFNLAIDIDIVAPTLINNEVKRDIFPILYPNSTAAANTRIQWLNFVDFPLTVWVLYSNSTSGLNWSGRQQLDITRRRSDYQLIFDSGSNNLSITLPLLPQLPSTVHIELKDLVGSHVPIAINNNLLLHFNFFRSPPSISAR